MIYGLNFVIAPRYSIFMYSYHKILCTKSQRVAKDLSRNQIETWSQTNCFRRGTTTKPRVVFDKQKITYPINQIGLRWTCSQPSLV